MCIECCPFLNTDDAQIKFALVSTGIRPQVICFLLRKDSAGLGAILISSKKRIAGIAVIELKKALYFLRVSIRY
ncbi:MAG: hypothetical protein EBX50_06870 [Chitinophagia bacterium]|nr:hypothetical protein [Chitinophagia bacterium]